MKSVESDLFSRPLSIRFYRRNTGRIVFERGNDHSNLALRPHEDLKRRSDKDE